MIELLKEPFNQFLIASTIGIVGIFVAIILYILKNKKEISYHIVSQTSLLPFKEDVEGKIKVFYENVEVKKLDLLIFTVCNSGKVDIEKKDFERPLSFGFGTSAKILDLNIISKNPENLAIEYEINNNKIFLNPTLLNHGDSYTIKILIKDNEKIFEPDCRIKGIKEIKKKQKPDKRFALIVGLTFIISYILNIISGWIFKEENLFIKIIDEIFAFSLFFIGAYGIIDMVSKTITLIKKKRNKNS